MVIGQLRPKDVRNTQLMITKTVVVFDGFIALYLVCYHSGMYTVMFNNGYLVRRSWENTKHTRLRKCRVLVQQVLRSVSVSTAFVCRGTVYCLVLLFS
jgi:hypothetical protein